MADLGTAYVQIVPKATGIKGAVESQLGGSMGDVGATAGATFGSKFKGVATTALKGAAIGAIGTVLKKGFDRMTAIDNAKAKLTALGNSSKDVAKISNNAMESVKGTAYGMDAAMTTAASATAAGIKPGKELQRYLTLVGDAASVAGIDMQEMGSIFNKVAANGKMSTEEMNQLADRGIPIWQLLAKETGMSMSELRDAVSGGEISIKEFQNAIETGMGGAAKTIGSTTITGAISNIKASISRMGANFLGTADDADSFAGKLLPLMNKLMGFMGTIEKGASVLGGIFSSIIGPIMDGIGQALAEVGKNTGKLKPLKELLTVIGTAIGGVIKVIVPMLVPAIRLAMNIVGAIMQQLRPLTPVISGIGTVVKGVAKVIVPVVKGIMKTVRAVVKFVTGKMSFKGLVASVGNTWRKVKNKMTQPITKAKEKIAGIISKIKGKFPFNIGKILKLKLPKIEVKGGKAPWGIGGLGTKPKFSVSWAAKGGIVDGATLVGAGEAGAEAIVPLDPFWNKLDAKLDGNGSGGVLSLTINLDGDTIGRKTIEYINGQTLQFGTSTF